MGRHMTKAERKRRDRRLEQLGKVLRITITIQAIMLVILISIAIVNNRKIAILEKELESTQNYLYEERETLKQEAKSYIDSVISEEFTCIEEIFASNVQESEVILLAKLMHAEEGVLRQKLSPKEAKKAHMLCGSVVLHRKNMHYMGANTIADVIYTPGQYGSIKNLEQEVPEETIEWARELLQNGPLGPEDMIFQAEFPQGEDIFEYIGNQYFCTMNMID